MRPIKFRAWDKIEKFMETGGEFGPYLRFDGNVGFSETGSGTEATGSWQYWEDESERFILMQFTGLHDKNGKGIYEGDVLKYNGVVEFKFGKWLIVNKQDDLRTKILYDAIADTDEQEIIGNIYEHPHLLEKK